jgi:serine/threonine-protein kinase
MAFPRPFGRYVLEERLAMGGMAEIFRARMTTHGFEKKCVIKRILPHYLEQPDFVNMFRDEAALAARLQHANIVQVFDFGEEEQSLYLAMEFVNGADLKRVLTIANREGDRIGIGHATQIAIEMCRALYYAHNLVDDDDQPLGIVHRDISPHNVLISRAGEVKVTDFGIAKAAARATHTGTGVVKGKLAYMSPEQASSQPVDHRLDQFATGIVLWEMLTGSRLFGGDDEMSVLKKVMLCEVPSPCTLRPEVPESLETALMRALSEKPEDRFEDMRAFENALTRSLFEHTSDPEESNVRALVERILLSPKNSRRQTAVLEPAASGAAASPPPDDTSLTETDPKSAAPTADDRPPVRDGAPAVDVFAATREIGGAKTNPSRPVPRPAANDSPTVVLDPRPAPALPAEEDDGELADTEKVDITAPTGPHVLPARVQEEAPPRRAPLFAAAVAGAAVVLGLATLLVPTAAPAPTSSTTTAPSVPATEPEPEAAAAARLAVPPAQTTPPAEAPTPAEAPAPAEPAPPPASAAAEPEGPAAPRRAATSKPRGKGEVFIMMEKGWATAWLGKRKLCETPCKVDLPAGSHQLRLVLPDGSSRTHRVRVRAGQRVRALVPGT